MCKSINKYFIPYCSAFVVFFLIIVYVATNQSVFSKGIGFNTMAIMLETEALLIAGMLFGFTNILQMYKNIEEYKQIATERGYALKFFFLSLGSFVFSIGLIFANFLLEIDSISILSIVILGFGLFFLACLLTMLSLMFHRDGKSESRATEGT